MQRISVTVILLLACVAGFSQAALQNNGNLRIHTGANMATFGAFTNASTAALVNNGTLYLRGNVTNNQASMSAGSGATHFNGTSAQSVNGTQAFRVNNLTTNNSSGITLNNNLNVVAVHTFTAGRIASSATPNYLVYEAGSSYTGSSDAEHVSGWVKKIGSTNFIFPVGSASVLRPIAVSTLSASSEFNAQYAGATSNTSNVLPNLVTVDPYEYWNLNQVSGGTAVVDINWDNSKVQFPNYLLASIRVANYSAGMWTNRGGTATGNVTTTGSISSPAQSSFGAFVVGSLNFSLPLSFMGVTAKRKNSFSLVEWNTAEEYNVNHFEVERKDNNNNSFTKITEVPAHNSFSNHYEIEDHLPLEGTAYYRIKSVDRDGKYQYSKIVAVSDKSSGSMAVINNPARNDIYISVGSAPKGNYVYQLTDGSGKIVQAGQVLLDGQSVLDIPVSIKAAKGYYFIKVSNSQFEFRDKVFVQ
ncbi:MAG: hypothetical protein JNK79_20125 [Chitinophagaceae bacterium]|nr:hypothetical protein [Chitinophagaceae bacterium]